MIVKFRNKTTGQVWEIEHQDTIDRLKMDPEFEQVAEAPAEEPKPQEAAEEAPAEEPTPKKSRKGS